MIQEAYISFETAKLLKEKRFNERCYTCYVVGELSHYDYSSPNNELIDEVISAPTQQMAMRWLREEKEIAIVIKPYPNEDGFCYVYEIKKLIGRDNILIRKVEPVKNM